MMMIDSSTKLMYGVVGGTCLEFPFSLLEAGCLLSKTH